MTSPSTSSPMPHGRNSTAAPVVVLKSPPYGAAGRTDGGDGPLPYRIDLLAAPHRPMVWSDDPVSGRPGVRRALVRLEAATVPFRQAWRTRRARRGAAAVLAMFESEGHGLALWRRTSRRSHPPLVVVACWLTDLVDRSPRRAAVYRRLYRAVDRVVVFSANQVPVLEQQLGISADRVRVVRFGIDLDELLAHPVADEGTVVAVGRDLGRDWPTLLLAAAGPDGPPWNLHVVTRPGQVAGLEVPAGVRLHPPVDRPAYLELLSRAAVVVVPTDVRQYPTGQTVLLEAMALGKACVVTDTPAMREYVRDGETGVLVPPHDPAALRQAVDGLLADPDRRRSLGRAAREAETAHGGAAAMWQEVGQILGEVSPEQRPSAIRPGSG